MNPATTSAASGDLYRMTPFEIATGWLTGEDEGAPSPATDGRIPGPLETLEALLTPLLERPPCVVAFSGGRDSSAVLAIACRVASREGLPAPIAATLRYPEEQATSESEWQELVLRHLDVSEWVKLDASEAADLLGPLATAGLRRHGVLWPPCCHTIVPLVRLASGGSLVTGDGGDEVLGDHRSTPWARLLARRVPRSRTEVLHGALAAAPRGLRRQALARSLRLQLSRSWLQPDAQDLFADLLVRDRLGEPFAWATGLQRLWRMRAWRVGYRNQDVLAAADGTRILRPLQDPAFLVALGCHGPRWGFPDRSVAMQTLFTTLLPGELLERKTKAVFNRVAFGPHSRAFVDRWDRNGVPVDLVDVEVLQSFWTRDMPHALSFALLQAAWLAEASAAERRASRTLA